jgi:hypothetical protein
MNNISPYDLTSEERAQAEADLNAFQFPLKAGWCLIRPGLLARIDQIMVDHSGDVPHGEATIYYYAWRTT